jgi:hypothetical protein
MFFDDDEKRKKSETPVYRLAREQATPSVPNRT